MESNIKFFINARVHTRGCNLRCDYCYLWQHGHVNDKANCVLRNSLDYVLKAFSPKRLGGICYINLAGDGETMLPEDIEELLLGLMDQGHYLTVFTNGTMSGKIKSLILKAKSRGISSHIHFNLSLHYLELERLGLKNKFTETAHFLKKEGISVSVSVILGKSYVPVIDDIKAYCDTELHIKPQIGRAFNEDDSGNVAWSLTDEEYENAVARFVGQTKAPQLDNFHKKEKRFCYAGQWSLVLDLTTGVASQCVNNSDNIFNFYDSIDQLPELLPVGNCCKAVCCFCNFRDRWNLVPEEKIQLMEDGYEEETERYITQEIKLHASQDMSLSHLMLSTEEMKKVNDKNLELQLLQQRIVLILNMFKNKNLEDGIKEAEVLFQQELDPHNCRVQELIVKYGYALMELGDIDGALALVGCWDDMSYCADYCFMLGTAYMKAGDISSAIRCFESAEVTHVTLEEGMNTWLPKYNLGVIYECLGDVEIALQYYNSCGAYKQAEDRIRVLTGKHTE